MSGPCSRSCVPFLIKTRLAEDLAAATPLPEHPSTLVIDPAVGVDKYPTVAFDCNRYSVPRPFAHRMVTVKGYVDRVVLIAEGRAVAAPRASYQKQTLVLDPVHYLATLGRKPGHDHAAGVPQLGAAGMLHRLPHRAGKLHSDDRRTTVRAGIATPGRASPDPHAQAIDACLEHLTSTEAVIQRTRSFATIEATTRTASPPQRDARRGSVQVPLPDLNCYNHQFLRRPRKTINHLQMR